jgi:hypothetical protein
MNAVSGLLTPAPTALAGGDSLDKTKPGLVAFLIILAMGLALWALLKNMGKQLGRAKEHFEAEDAALAAQAVPAVPAPVQATVPVAKAQAGTAEAVAGGPKPDSAKNGGTKKDGAKKSGTKKDTDAAAG